MCGIVGYTGYRRAKPPLIKGLKRLEYRGYDSTGIVTVEQLLKKDGSAQSVLETIKSVGKVARLKKILIDYQLHGTTGIAHTRWATHGVPSTLNAHPHVDTAGEFALVHNGIIENYQALQKFLSKSGVKMKSQTDTEVLVHLIRKEYKGDFLRAVQKALAQVQGTYGLAVVSSRHPGMIIVARNGSPLVIGCGQGEHFIGSDVSAFIDYTKDVVYLNDGEVASVTPDQVIVRTIRNKKINPVHCQVCLTLEELEKAGHKHFMHKEIHEQPKTLRNACRGRIDYKKGTFRLDGLNISARQIKAIKRVVISACGTSWHSGLIGEVLIEELAGLPVKVVYASEYRYRSPVVEKGTLFISISQSGETIDTLGGQREAKKRGARVIGIVNVVGSTIARENDGGIYIHAGPEIGVASTKAFTSQVMVLTMLAVFLGRVRGNISQARGRQLIKSIQEIPGHVEEILKLEPQIIKLARRYFRKGNFLYLGRGINFPTALEGALKLKEISYIHAEGYPAAEMKHGPIALIDKQMPVVFIALDDPVYTKVLSNIREVHSRHGIIIAIASKGNRELAKYAKHVIHIPNHISKLLTPILAVIPLQLLAYHVAVLRKRHIDQPRNLAKSVTVE